MAYLPIENEDEKKSQSGQEQVLTSGSGSVDGGNNSGNAVSAAGDEGSKPARKGTGWLNLQNYVEANRDNNLANKVSGAVTQQGKEIQQDQESFRDTAKSKINSSVIKDDGIVDSLKSSPTSVVQDEARKQRFYDQYNASYKGPQSVEEYDDYRDINQRLTDLNSRLEASKTEEGRVALLEDEYGRTDYSGGEKRLDSFLMGQDADQFNQVAKDRDYLTDNWNSILGGLGSEIENARSMTEATRQSTRDALSGSLSEFDKYIEEVTAKAGSRNQEFQKQFNDTKAMLSSTDAAKRNAGYQAAGIDPSLGEWLQARGVSPAQLISEYGKANLGDFTSAEDVSKYEALMDLAGKEKSLDFSKSGVDSWFKRNDDILNSTSSAKALQDAINAKVQAENENRRIHHEAAGHRLRISDPNFAGLTPAQYQEARQYGIDPVAYLSAGAQLDSADVMSDAQRQQWADLQAALGFTDNFKTMDTQNEGGAWNFDLDSFLRAIEGARPAPVQQPPPPAVMLPPQAQPAGTLAVQTSAGNPIYVPPKAPVDPVKQAEASKLGSEHQKKQKNKLPGQILLDLGF